MKTYNLFRQWAGWLRISGLSGIIIWNGLSGHASVIGCGNYHFGKVANNDNEAKQ